jgi:ATP phosphoribosyltransferase regulatory subunit
VRLRRAVASLGRLRRELTNAMGEGDAPAPARRRLTDLLSGLSEEAAAGVLEEVWALAGVEPVGGRSAADIAHRLLARAALDASPRLAAHQAERILKFLAIDDRPLAALEAVKALGGDGGPALAGALAAWEDRLAALELAGVPADRIRLSTALGRTFSYYDGMVFEIRSAALPDDQAVAAGGRYDSLAARLGTPLATGAVGCMVRPGRAWREARA